MMINNVKKAIEELFDEYKQMLQPQCEKVSENSQLIQIIKANELGLEKER